MSLNEKQENIYKLHLGIAEQGKLYALKGNYKEALRYYKEAIKLTEHQPKGDLFFQHYMQCTMEALELMGGYDDVLNYCEKFLGLLLAQKTTNALIPKYIAEVEQRMAIQYLLKNEHGEATKLFKKIQQDMGKGAMALSDELLNWILRGYTISKKQLFDLQTKYKYFIVQKGSVKPEIAMELPKIINHF